MDSSSSDEEGACKAASRKRGSASAADHAGDEPAEPLVPPLGIVARSGGSLLERSGDECFLSERQAEAPARAPAVVDDSEDIFEIRDFTTASSFERIAHQISLAAKKWAALLRNAGHEDQHLREEFNHMGFKYEVLFQIVQHTDKSGSSADRLGLHTFPTRAHRLQRWFGVQHFLVVSVFNQDIDVDSARTVLSASVLAAESVSPAFSPPLSCFVPVDGGRRRRYLGELISAGSRVSLTVDQRTAVDPSLEHLEGLQTFFWRKMEADAAEHGRLLMMGARFTYLADRFDFPEVLSGSTRQLADSPVQKRRAAGPGDGGQAGTAAGDGPESQPKSGGIVDLEQVDPVESVQLHCLWPSFPRDSFVDNAVYSELDPRIAPYWKIRLLRTEAGEAPLPLTRGLQNLLEFRNEAKSVRSAEQSMQTQLPKTALASLSFAIQESLESILLPTEAEMREFVLECMSSPIAKPKAASAAAQGPDLSALRGARGGTRMAVFAELSSRLRCFKAAVMLWCQVLIRMRRQWDDLEPPPPSASSPETRCVSARGLRTEHFDTAHCLVQQKFEMFQRSLETQVAGDLRPTAAAAAPTELQLEATGAPLLSPLLLRPALLTEDMVIQLDMATASILEPAERAELHSKELRSDMAALKAANPDAGLPDFVAWRSKVSGLSLQAFPMEWLEEQWRSVAPQAASEQTQSLFEPMREAEMALHYLENMEGTQLLLQVFRTRLCSTLEELSGSIGESSPPLLRVLRDRAVAACRSAISGSGSSIGAGDDGEGRAEGVAEYAESDPAAAVVSEVDDFPHEDNLQAAVAAVEALEGAVRLVASLRAKLPGPGLELVEELLTEGEASVTSHPQRHVIEELFARSRALGQSHGRETPDSRGVFESLPLAKEFVLQVQGAGDGAGSGKALATTKRMYAEIRSRHLRLAVARGFTIA